jgi:hypothetical protein
MQTVYAKDPITGWDVRIIEDFNGKYAIVRQMPSQSNSLTDYLNVTLWWAENPCYFPTPEDVFELWDKYKEKWKGKGGLMSQYNYGVCPELGTTIVVFEYSHGGRTGFAVARQNAGKNNYTYMTENLEFIADSNSPSVGVYKVKQEAEAKADAYRALVFNQSILPIMIDQTRMRFMFRCPHCCLVHKFAFGVATWDELTQIVNRNCPKTQEKVYVKIWNPVDPRFKTANKRQPTALVGDIDQLPKSDCKECFGSGEYVGFNHVEVCSTCFPKK